MASSHRVNKVRELLYREFSDIVQNLKDPRIALVTVVDAEVSADLKHSRMFVSVMGSDEEKREAVVALGKALGYIRYEIAQRIRMRHVPEINVVYDNTAERAARLTSLIDQAVSVSATASERYDGQSWNPCDR